MNDHKIQHNLFKIIMKKLLVHFKLQFFTSDQCLDFSHYGSHNHL
ncbi:hypothetical protein A35E_00403 [secondary endosymbiont of Heteropsylla cubana]|uniref:Uncharacterized protein n=1 Tax=secondary endosymbiont of Heteropsylla cubana TaxID=134287 RepID=J3YTC4_9ENTR|nr:hypothetical protein A35E_00403 [secondary endosymbiont of Heteropsylla cubana]